MYSLPTVINKSHLSYVGGCFWTISPFPHYCVANFLVKIVLVHLTAKGGNQMLEKMKFITRKLSIILLATLLLIPANTVSAKGKIDISKVANKKLARVVSYLNLKEVKDNDPVSLVYTPTGKESSNKILLTCNKLFTKINGAWVLSVETKNISIYGITVKMTRKQVESKLLKNGWKCIIDDPKILSLYYEDAKGHQILVEYKNHKKNSKIASIGFSNKIDFSKYF